MSEHLLQQRALIWINDLRASALNDPGLGTMLPSFNVSCLEIRHNFSGVVDHLGDEGPILQLFCLFAHHAKVGSTRASRPVCQWWDGSSSEGRRVQDAIDLLNTILQEISAGTDSHLVCIQVNLIAFTFAGDGCFHRLRQGR